MNPRAETPFHFFSRLTLTALTGKRASTLQEMTDVLRTAPDTVVYQHTHRYLFQHQFLTPEPPNDFAYWAHHMLGDERIGERLAAVDTIRFNTLSDLRTALIEAIEKNSSRDTLDRKVPEGKDFHFMSAVRFSVPTEHRASTLSEFRDGLKRVAISSLYLHVFEARLRPPLGRNDFSLWFEKELKLPALAEKVAALDPYTQTLEGLRMKILHLVDEELSHAEA